MINKKLLAAVAVVLVAGLTLGFAVTAGAATDTQPTAGCDLGLRLGATMRDAGGRMADIVASLTGKSAEEIQAERQAGSSFADIAEGAGVSADDVVAEALAVRKQLLDEAVAAGTITQEQADAALVQMESKLAERIDTAGTGCAGGGAGGCGGGMGNGAGRGAGRGMGACQGVVQ